MELQAINYITTRIERLPITESSSFTGEGLPTLFPHNHHNHNHNHHNHHNHQQQQQQQQGQGERSSKTYNVNKASGHKRDRSASRYDAALSNLNANAKAWIDASYDMKSKGRQTIYELLNSRDQTGTLQEDAPVSKQTDELLAVATATNFKRKRSTDSGESESFKSICDDEVRRICLPENRMGSQRFQYEHRRCSSPKKKLFPRTSAEQKRFKTHSFVQCEARKKRSISSTSWLPARLCSSERKVKVIRIAPLNSGEMDMQTFYSENVRSEAFFRPIRAEDG